MIDKYEAEIAIRELANRLPEESESMISAMVDCNATAPDASIEKHSQWRQAGGVPNFTATIHYHNEAGYPLVGCHYIQVTVCGTFKQNKKGLTVDSCVVEECELIDLSEGYARY